MTKTATQPYKTFEHRNTVSIDSLQVEVAEYTHLETGAKHFHLAADHNENVFMVAFRTIPKDSTGVAHILEHTTLCGSQKYPVRDPFFMMIRRSLNTFMNAFTSSDWTAYPFASQNQKDFENLLSVYLDAVFFPRLDPLDFAQEGHRVEFVDNNINSELVYKGVVFNEMKGAMSSPVSTLYKTVNQHLFPTTTYHFNSGGDPEHIPDLSYEQLLAFHRDHYCASNATFMTYGNIPAAQHQQNFEAQALSKLSQSKHIITVPEEKRRHAPLIVTDYYAHDPQQSQTKQTHHVLAWLLNSSIDLNHQLEAHLLSGVLLNNSASPLRKALETFPGATSPSSLCGIEDSHREISFLCGVEGSEPEQAEAFEEMVLTTLQEVADQGVPQDMVDAVLHQLELHQREVGGDHYPYGLQLLLTALPAAIHRGNPIALLDLDPAIAELHNKCQDPDLIKRLTKDLLIDNPHRIRLSLVPDPKLSTRQEQAEKVTLQRIKTSLSESQSQAILTQTQALEKRQKEIEDLSILPKVEIADIPATVHYPKAESGNIQVADHAPLTRFNQGTNGIVYQQIIINLPKFSPELTQLLPLYTYCLPELGCGDKDYLAMQAWQAAVSGGIGASYSVLPMLENNEDIKGHIILSTKGLQKNHQAISELLQTTLNQARFDELERIRELIGQKRMAKEKSVTGNGHGLAMSAAASGCRPIAALGHLLSGLESIKRIKALDDSLADKKVLAKIAKQLTEIHNAIQVAPKQFLLIGEEANLDQYCNGINEQWSVNTRPKSSDLFTPFNISFEPQHIAQVWLTTTQVNFCAQAYPVVPANHSDAPALSILGNYLWNGFLHSAIREQGGAYGSGASYDSSNGIFRFFSYRDPRLQETLKDFEQSIQWLLQEKGSDELLEQSILKFISGWDKPSSPAGEAKKTFHSNLYGRTEAFRQGYRKKVLEVTFADLQRVANTYLTQKPHTAVISQPTTWTSLKETLSLTAIDL